ncbi:hypothetical protein [Undibacterium sp. TS12]|uniref:hypothetical protein n=1 Tax=Undibacterium sp. TS12 TaxID=2908202 RepID=UPI001F4CB262|nr:hypothetical protein [Undibacterium sp. TS12]MCH8620428.1 hypothetical protein [Undibacterium sp. TS12]
MTAKLLILDLDETLLYATQAHSGSEPDFFFLAITATRALMSGNSLPIAWRILTWLAKILSACALPGTDGVIRPYQLQIKYHKDNKTVKNPFLLPSNNME